MRDFHRMWSIWLCLLHACVAGLGAQQDNYAEAETALLRALKEAEDLGLGHLRLADALYNLGSFYQAAAKPADAEKFYLRSLSTREKILGTDQASLAEPLNG